MTSPDIEALVGRLRATDYIHNRGPNYEPLPVEPSDLRLQAAECIATLQAQVAGLRGDNERLRKGWKENAENLAGQCCDAITRAENAEKRITELRRERDEALEDALAYAGVAKQQREWKEAAERERDALQEALLQSAERESALLKELLPLKAASLKE